MTDFTTMTELGKLFDESSHTIGKWLTVIGLRTSEMKPSQRAFDEGFVKQAPTGRGQGVHPLNGGSQRARVFQNLCQRPLRSWARRAVMAVAPS